MPHLLPYTAEIMGEFNPTNFLNAAFYAVVGVGLFLVVFFLFDRLTPYRLWDEIVGKQNMALAVLLGFLSLGICLIIAMAVH